MSRMKSAVGICARHEHKYIQECLCFHYLQGWDRIIVGILTCPSPNGR